MDAEKTFERFEKKYLIGTDVLEQLMQCADGYLCPDRYPKSTVCNLYFDTSRFDFIRESIEQPVYKEKLRLRSYGVPKEEDTVFLEIKKKFNGIVYKRRIALTQQEARDFIDNGTEPSDQGPILQEIENLMDRYRPTPRLFLAYDREAFRGTQDTELRITVDRNLRFRTQNIDLTAGDDGAPLIDPCLCIMEIKTSEAMPLWLAHALSDAKIWPASFSKYGTAYKEHLICQFMEEYSCYSTVS